jgi:hypothetical protein
MPGEGGRRRRQPGTREGIWRLELGGGEERLKGILNYLDSADWLFVFSRC